MSLETFASFCGVDVIERQLDVHLLPDGAGASFAHTATGGLKRALVVALDRVIIAAAVVNPRQIRDFARAADLLAKTDRLDARVLGLFAERMRPQPRLPGSAADALLASVVIRHRQLAVLRDAERNPAEELAGLGIDPDWPDHARRVFPSPQDPDHHAPRSQR